MIQVDPCRSCRGRGTLKETRRFEVHLPRGTSGGDERVLHGQGEPGRFGGDPGDLRITVNVRPHRWLSREGDRIRCEAVVSVTEAALGAKIPVPSLEGTLLLEVPSGTQSGTKMRLRGKGVPRREGRGDQIVTVVVETPRVLEEAAGLEMTRLLDQLEQASTGAPRVLPRRREQRQAWSPETSPESEPDPSKG
jgi:molecular chaperone DnaJ